MTETDYDRIDYGGNAQFFTSPNLVAGVGRLLGVPCPSPRRARVLELGCGNASNLIPLAWYWPDSEFVGFDLAQTPIDQGCEVAAALGLRNLSLQQADVTALDVSRIGRFDYVIAHGLFSWVPAPVRTAILRLIASVLNPMGIGYISYNAYPGCRVRHLVREMMHFQIGERPLTLDTARAAFALLESVDTVPKEQQPEFFKTLSAEAANSTSNSVNYLFHDDLSVNNQPYYLHEFDRMAGEAGLSYLGDASFGSMFEPDGVPDLTHWLDQSSGGDWMRRQQFFDFATGTRFRRSLVCRQQDGVKPAIDQSAVSKLHFFSEYRAQGLFNPGDNSEVTFADKSTRSFTTTNTMLKSVMLMLALTPNRTIAVDELAQRVVGAAPELARESAAHLLLRTTLNGVAVPLAERMPAVTAPDPEILLKSPLSGLSRYYLSNHRMLVDNANRAFNLSETWLNDLVLQFDGTQDAGQLAETAKRLVAEQSGTSAPGHFTEGLTGLLQMLGTRGLLGTPWKG